jgi:hypothetical protein
MGGRLSWSMALLDPAGDGTVITSIHGRSDARTYAKRVSGWQADQQLSPEEEEAVQQAKKAEHGKLGKQAEPGEQAKQPAAVERS